MSFIVTFENVSLLNKSLNFLQKKEKKSELKLLNSSNSVIIQYLFNPPRGSVFINVVFLKCLKTFALAGHKLFSP